MTYNGGSPVAAILSARSPACHWALPMPPFPLRKPALCVALALIGSSAAAGTVRVALEPVTKLEASRVQGGNDAASFISAERIEGSPDEELHLTGSAEIRRGGSVLKGDRITYTQETDEVEVVGSARISRQGASFSGPSMRFRITSRSGSMDEADWEYAPRNLRGCAKNVKFLSGDRTTFEDVTITTCRRDDMAWHIHMNELEIDEYDQTAEGTGSVFYFQGVPLLAAPWFSFPVSPDRRSGLLTPTFGMSSTRGLDLSVPYYFNLAPNYDWTVTPRVLSKRGVMLGNEFRLMEPGFLGSVNFDFLANDRLTDEKRWALRAEGSYTYEKMSFLVDFNKVSDDDYISDFSGNIRESSDSVLPQDFTLRYDETYWNSFVRVTKNQTLNEVRKPYERVPQVRLEGYNGDYYGFELNTILDATRFRHPDRIGGMRFVAHQTVSYPLLGPGWFIIPKGQFIGTWYDLTDLRGSGYSEQNPSRMSPIFSLDSGLVFERDTHFFGRGFAQTLEPRIFYAYSPYRDQSDIPVFDTTVADLNFSTLFTENIFAGYDRVAEANQLSLVLSTRFIDQESGLEVFHAGIGQRQYFRDQRVQFLNSEADYDYFGSRNGSGLREDVRSDLLASAGARLSRNITTSATVHYSSSQSSFVKVNSGIQWTPGPMKSLGLYYRYNTAMTDPDDYIKQVDFAAQWPVSERLNALLRYNYSFYKKQPIEIIGGFEYFHDCWTKRFVAQRYINSENQRETNFFVQLELAGLGSIGSSPLSELRRSIKTYQTREMLPGTIHDYDYYE